MRTIADRYVVERHLGGDVFVARDRVLDRRVALQHVPGGGAERVREARAVARLSHPNVIQVFDAGTEPDGSIYVAMELVDGVTLDRWRVGRPPRAVVAAFHAAARGLAAAHAAGIAHGDFRAEKVIVDRHGRVRVSFLGRARGDDDVRALLDALGDLAPPGLRTIDEIVAALAPPRDRRRIVAAIALAAVAAVLTVLAVVLAGDPPVRPPAAPTGYSCGPVLQTYAVEGGVRCVLFAHDPDGTPWLAWYGEGVRDGAAYRQVGEGRLGGAGTIAAIDGGGDGAVRIEPELAGARIAIRGAVGETWVRTAGTHAGYTSHFTDPVGLCGPQLRRYRSFSKWRELWGKSTVCMMPGGRTWLASGRWQGHPHLHVGTSTTEDGEPGWIAADVCHAPEAACGDVAFGELTMRPRHFPGAGDGFDVTGHWPLLLVP